MPQTLRNRFCWNPESRILFGGQAGGNLDRTLAALRQVIDAGTDFGLGPDGQPRPLPARPSGPYFQTLSGGSTAAPKIIRRSQQSWIASFTENTRLFDLSSADCYAVLGKPVHSLALYAMLEALHLGADLLLLADQRPDRQAVAMAAQGASILYVTPAQLRQLCRQGVNMPTLRHILCGGGMLGADVRRLALACCPNATLTEFYGAAETSFVTLSDAGTPLGSVGRAYPHVQVQIQAGGEVWVKSPYLFDDYAEGGCGQATRDHDGFLTVGEVGYLDDQGYLFLEGRKDRMVTIADQNVFPEQAEAFLASDRQVGQVAVLPVFDARRGNILCAILSGPEDAALAARLLAASRASLGPLRAPRHLLFCAEFPVLASGKPDLRALAVWLEGRL
ncbi:MAG: AMP-binding protein [Paracoccaceae bacterium]